MTGPAPPICCSCPPSAADSLVAPLATALSPMAAFCMVGGSSPKAFFTRPRSVVSFFSALVSPMAEAFTILSSRLPISVLRIFAAAAFELRADAAIFAFVATLPLMSTENWIPMSLRLAARAHQKDRLRQDNARRFGLLGVLARQPRGQPCRKAVGALAVVVGERPYFTRSIRPSTSAISAMASEQAIGKAGCSSRSARNSSRVG